jgi:hypothetical protein
MDSCRGLVARGGLTTSLPPEASQRPPTIGPIHLSKLEPKG